MYIFKRIQAIILIFVLVFTFALTPVKKSYAIAVVDDMAIVLTVMAAFGLSAYFANCAAEDIDWSVLSQEIEESYTNARDKFTVITGGGGKWDDEDGDGDEDADDLPTFDNVKTEISTTGKLAMSTNMTLLLYQFGNGLWQKLGNREKIKFDNDKINNYIDAIYGEETEFLEYEHPSYAATVDLSGFSRLSGKNLNIMNSMYIPSNMLDKHLSWIENGYDFVCLVVENYMYSTSNYRKFTFQYVSKDLNDGTLDFKYQSGGINSGAYADTLVGPKEFYTEDYVKNTVSYSSNSGNSPVFHIPGTKYTNVDVYYNPDLTLKIDGKDVTIGGEKLTKFPIEPVEIPDPTKNPLEVPTQEKVQQLEELLNDPSTSEDAKKDAINNLTESVNPNLNPENNSDIGGSTEPGGDTDTGTGSGDEPSSSDGTKFLLPDSIKDKFPFCVPFDLINAFSVLESSDRNAPRITWNLKSEKYNVDYTFDVDMSVYDDVAKILRNMELLLFGVGLILLTRSIIRG